MCSPSFGFNVHTFSVCETRQVKCQQWKTERSIDEREKKIAKCTRELQQSGNGNMKKTFIVKLKRIKNDKEAKEEEEVEAI